MQFLLQIKPLQNFSWRLIAVLPKRSVPIWDYFSNLNPFIVPEKKTFSESLYMKYPVIFFKECSEVFQTFPWLSKLMHNVVLHPRTAVMKITNTRRHQTKQKCWQCKFLFQEVKKEGKCVAETEHSVQHTVYKIDHKDARQSHTCISQYLQTLSESSHSIEQTGLDHRLNF